MPANPAMLPRNRRLLRQKKGEAYDSLKSFELAIVLACFDHVARFIVNANHSSSPNGVAATGDSHVLRGPALYARGASLRERQIVIDQHFRI
jgi:hypothetical protein